MLIYFLRHGDASSSDEFNDHERPLTELGKKQAESVGNFLFNSKVYFDAVISSPMLRAQQTASAVLSKFDRKEFLTSDLLLNGTDPGEIFNYLDNQNVSCVLLISHIPLLEKLISLLIYGISESDIELKKCSLALVETRGRIDKKSGKLRMLLHVNEISDKLNM